jgi:hypothetical protein
MPLHFSPLKKSPKQENSAMPLLRSSCCSVLTVFILGLFAHSLSALESVHLDPEFGQVPLSFVINEGQFDPALKFVAEGNAENAYWYNSSYFRFDLPVPPAAKVAHSSQEMSVTKTSDPSGSKLGFHFYQANMNPAIIGEDPYSWKSNYFFGNDPTKWKTDLANYKSVRLN